MDRAYVLYGVADRDSKELVCQFFDNLKDLREFAAELPGTYQRMTLQGVNFDNLEVVGMPHHVPHARVIRRAPDWLPEYQPNIA